MLRRCSETKGAIPVLISQSLAVGADSPGIVESSDLLLTSAWGCFMMSRMSRDENVESLMSEDEFRARCAGLRGVLAQFFVTKDGQRLYPSFLADSTVGHRDLIAVVKLLGDWDNFTKWRFFVSGKGSLGGLTPLEALKQGRLRQVMRTAEGFAER